MGPYQQRVIDEKAALDEKLVKLLAFMSSETVATVTREERIRLNCQCRLMGQYSDILAQRIAAFDEK